MERDINCGEDAMYRLLVQGGVDYASYLLSPDGVVLNWNVGSERANGYSADEIIGENFARFYTEEDRRAGLPQRVLAQARAEGRFSGEGWRVRRDKSRFWASVVVKTIREEGGDVIGFAKITRDLTAQKLQDDALRRAIGNLNLALANMSQGLILFDAEERLVLCNAHWCEFLGCDEASTRSGTTFATFLASLLASAGTKAEDIPARVTSVRERHLGKVVGAEGTVSEEVVLHGRALHFSHRPLPGGGWVTTVDDVTERRRIEERVAYLAHHDLLTGLPSRAAIHQAIRDATPAYATHRPCALLYLNLDQFKPVNDTYGHHAGDTVLRVVADRIRGLLRGHDAAARLGGDEFVVVAHDCPSGSSAMGLARRLIWEIGQPIEVEGGTVTVGASIGIALMPIDGIEADTLLRHADLALYRAKAEGRDGCRLYDPALAAELRQRRELERELREALARDGFALRYQPVIDAEEDRPTSFEALLRWTSPTRGPISPADFIPFAEEIGLMPEIDDWVLRQACLAARTWPDGITVSVNLSPTGFRRPDLVGRIAAILSKTGLQASRLELEITETAAIDDLSAARGILEGIRALGVQIALDDFGTGHSSLSLLRALPFGRIKIDRSFVQDMETDPHSAAIVTAVCGLCRSLGVRATAEGVETTAQVRRLHAEGCTDLQGYLIGRPLPAEAVPDWLGAFGSSRTDRPGGSLLGEAQGA